MPRYEWSPDEIYNLISDFIEKKRDKKTLYVYISEKETKIMRTKAQNNTFYMLFDWIWKHLWEDTTRVKMYFMWWCFWVKKTKLSNTYMELPIKIETHLLEKHEWIFLIDTLLAFIKIKNIPIKITSREITDLYNSYN